MASPEKFQEIFNSYREMLEDSQKLNSKLADENQKLKEELGRYERREEKIKGWLGPFYNRGW